MTRLRSASPRIGRRLALALLTAGATYTASAEEIVKLEPQVVKASSAGQFSLGNTPTATLKTVEIAMVPGSAADINRALQTLPGVQMADKGNALFVRGGDSRETATWINGIKFPGSPQLNSPVGTFSGTISPWQASSMEFDAGGFGASTGDVLSGAVKIKTFGAPHDLGYTANLSTGNIGGAVSWPWTSKAGVTFTASRNDLTPYMKLCPPSRDFREPPQGYDYSIADSWDYRPGGKIKWYGMGQQNQLALPVNELTRSGMFRSQSDTTFGVVSWNDDFGTWKQEASVGGGQTAKDESMAGATWKTTRQTRQFTHTSSDDLGFGIFRFGTAYTDEQTHFAKGFLPDGSSEPFSLETHSHEQLLALWEEYEFTLGRHVQVVSGLRGWHSRRADETRVDPRCALTWKPQRHFTTSFAAGINHQVPEGIEYAPGLPRWPAMQADQVIASVEWKQGAQLLRAEAYTKRYRHLVALDRDFMPEGAGVGQAHGLDRMVKTSLVAEIKGRLTWSRVDADRTDPSSGIVAPAHWAVKHSATLILDRTISGWMVSLAARWASGRAFTPVIGSAFQNGVQRPVFGPPNSENYPSFPRLDCTLARSWTISDRVTAVTYLAAFNLTGWKNVYAYDYSDDFSEKRPVPGLFGRSVYCGVNLLFR